MRSANFMQRRLAVAVKVAASIQNCEHKAHKMGIEHGSWRTPGVMYSSPQPKW
jgi:hypothetical protein